MKSLLGLIFTIATAYGTGEFSVVHHPGSIVFRGHDAIKQRFYIENPFNIPEAIVTIAVDGVKDIGQNKGHHYPLLTNDDEGRIYRSLAKRISERFPNEEPTLIRVDLANGLDDVKEYSIFQKIKSENPKHVSHKSLKLDVEEDRDFLKDIALLSQIAQKVEDGVVKQDYVPDVYWFRLSSLHALSDLHGENSTETKEAKQLLQNVIIRLTDAFSKAYGNHVFVNVLTSDASHTRVRRNILATDESNDKKNYNLASKYSDGFPAIFNIVLWLCVVLFFALLAICLATANMDPGRDSIIYRMTSTRMKKDN
ncbi:hypothetical protein GWI33_011172 [Rhynchophorus ferrugineus]|uniref:Renin receptor n=1 Tax=Rhynchophorus ferrugineus TaxID=354439 RepID=A0A834I8G6_RHYFE|nr:hypothetical protein GWI33_011172 [Rhynchophorus ferrugineus]